MLRDCGIPDDESKEGWAFRPGRVFAPVNQALVRDPFLFELKRTERCIRDIARVDADFRSPRNVMQPEYLMALGLAAVPIVMWHSIRDLDLYRGVRSGEPGGDGDDARLQRPGHLEGI
jgi:hypothetical protein